MLTSRPPEGRPKTIRRVDDPYLRLVDREALQNAVPRQSPSRGTRFGSDTLAAPLKQRGLESADPLQEVESCRTGLLRHVPLSEIYAVTVITGDVGEAVRAAGGWMCDRVRAGWRVLALIPEDCDPTPLQILGVRTSALATEFDCSWLTPKAATLAIGTDVLSLPIHISGHVRAMMSDHAIEVAVWGDGDIETEQRFQQVQHQLSPAAKCFKQHAMRAASLPDASAPTEFLRSCAPWYPLDQVVDLNTVAASGDGSL